MNTWNRGSVFDAVCAGACVTALACSMLPTTALAQTPQDDAARTAHEQTVQNITAQEGTYEDGTIIVTFRANATSTENGELSAQGADGYQLENIPDSQTEVIARSSANGAGAIACVELPDGVSVAEGVASAQENPAVSYAQPNYRYRLLDERDVPNDPIASKTSWSSTTPNQWYLESIHAYEAWSVAHADNKTTVAVLDTGINFEHSDLKANINTAYAYNAVTRTHMTESQTDSEMEHGSHVAGIIAAVANNEEGIAGVSWNANVLPICAFRLTDKGAVSNDEDLIAAYEYLMSDPEGDGTTIAQATNTHVVNMSLGGYIADDPSYEYDHAFEDIIEKAQDDANILTVAAGGNGDDYGNPRTDASYPSDYEAVMSVIALQSDTKRASFSDYNDAKDISAPGVAIYSTLINGDTYGFKSGTSMATPVVAGVAALLWAYNPNLTVADVKEALYSTAYDLGDNGKDAQYGWGRLDAQKAIESLGTVQVTAQSSTMVRTQRQSLTAAPIKESTDGHAWTWSIDASTPDIATIDAQTGELTARLKGTVKVNVVAQDDASLYGSRTITISDIELPNAIVASANPSENTINVIWDAATAATSYKVQRAGSQDGEYTSIGTVAKPDAAGGFSFADTNVKPGIEYWYKVVPCGTLGTETVDGVESAAVNCYYTDKSALKDTVDRAKNLRDTTEVSKTGAELTSNIYWVTSDERSALNAKIRAVSTVYYSGLVTQKEVDDATADLAQAIVTFEAARKPGLIKIIEEADVSVTSGSYTGTALGAVAVDVDGQSLTQNVDYSLAFSDSSGNEITSCVDAGTYHAIVSGMSPYTGVVTKEFSIAAANMTGAKIAAIETQEYAGAAVQPALTVTYGGKTLAVGSDYTVRYMNNDAPGVGTATVTGTGNYTGEISTTFTIKQVAGVGMHRLYNPNSGEHFYTASAGEKDGLVALGWSYEGVGWKAPAKSSTPVFRLYNPNAGDHHYTTDAGERDALAAVGWSYEGVGWYSDDARGTPLYRQYNPNATTGTHNYTTSAAERDMLVSAGWRDEGVGWYGLA